uniref:Uncharacterized protein n=1 Tax=Panagrolaimus davidi TaxID=227884 RepID=A0A914R041_9BILA
MEVEKEWSPEFRQKILKSFKNCSYEGHKISQEYKQLVKTVSNLEDEHANSIKALNVEMETLKNQLFEKDQKIEKLIDAAKFQNETHEKKIKLFEEKKQSLEKSVESLTQKLEQEKEKTENVEKEAEKKFETWKNEYQKNHDSIINKQKQLIKKICEKTDEKKPLWLVPKNVCDAIYQSHQKSFDLFISSYIKELFSLGELILPQIKLNRKKIEEALTVLKLYFYNSFNNKKALEEALKKERSETRQFFYQKVQKNGIIAINKIGEYYFYGFDSVGRKFIPFKDSQFTEPMNASILHGKYVIPDEYRDYGFILIIHISPANGICHNYLHAESGYLEENIHAVSKIEKKEKV